MTRQVLPVGYINSVLQNGSARYVCQLQRLTFNFCKTFYNSKGVRDFIEHHLIDFARENPGVAIYVQPKRRTRRPKLVGEYLNGRTEEQFLGDMTREEVRQWVEYMRTRSGQEAVRFRRLWHTDTPSIQGVWDPWTHRPTAQNLAQYPCPELSATEPEDESATERILRLAEELRQGGQPAAAHNYDVINTKPFHTVSGSQE